MQQVVFTEPYKFIPPLPTNLWPAMIQRVLPSYLRRSLGIHTVDCRHTERLRESLAAGHGILLTPNHVRDCDPLVLGPLFRQAGTHVYAMASWHVFKRDWFTTFLVRRMGGFSVFREGVDRAALNAAIDILEHARRPLIIFPEGARSRHNDVLMPLMDGVTFIARNAAKRRARHSKSGSVVIHPIAIRYSFAGDLLKTVTPVLEGIEARLSWQAKPPEPLVPRLRRIAEALLSLKEVEYFGRPQAGNLYDRVHALIEHLLRPLETEWNVGTTNGSFRGVVERVKSLRAKILPEMVQGHVSDAEQAKRWRQLADCYLAQQLSFYPADYVRANERVPERILETVERFEEDLTDQVTVHGPLRVVVEVGEALAVDTKRPPKGASDPLLESISGRLEAMLADLSDEAAGASAEVETAMV